MMRFLLLVLAALFFAIFIGSLLSADPGRVVFSWDEWVIQTSLGVFVFAFVAFFVLCYVLFWSAIRLIKLPRNYRKWRETRAHLRSEKYLNKGLLALVEGDWRTAEAAFRKGASYSNTPMVNYLGAARAAQFQGSVERRDHYLRLAHEYNGNSQLAVALTQAELQLGQQQVEQAYATLKTLNSDQPDHDQVKLLLLDATARLKEWQQMIELLQEFERKGVLPVEQIRARQLTAYAGLMQEAGSRSDLTMLEKIWSEIPVKLKKEIYLLETYTQERLRFSDTADCEVLLRKAIKKSWEPELVRLYGLVEGKDPVAQLAVLEKYLPGHDMDAVLLLTLGRLSKRNRLWGKARSYLEQSIAAQPNPEAYHELAMLLEQEGDHAAASVYYQEGLAIATNLPPGSARTLAHSAEPVIIEETEQ